jgi:hypothetical protein
VLGCPVQAGEDKERRQDAADRTGATGVTEGVFFEVDRLAALESAGDLFGQVGQLVHGEGDRHFAPNNSRQIG